MRWALAVWITGLALTRASAAPPADLPERLLSARTVLVVNDRVDAKVFNRIVNDFRKWRRYALVQSESDAQLIAILSQQPTGIELIDLDVVDKSNLYLVFKDGATRTLLWSEPAEMPGNWESLVSRFRKRVEKFASEPK